MITQWKPIGCFSSVRVRKFLVIAFYVGFIAIGALTLALTPWKLFDAEFC
jgi:hypothetical protein